MQGLLSDAEIAQRILEHIDNGSTDLGQICWKEPVAHYRSQSRLDRELEAVFRRLPVAFCPSGALPAAGNHVARDAGGVPIVVVRADDGKVRAFRNACRHRGAQLVCGRGSQKAFVCPYHAWTYGLDGTLRSVPHEHGFPGLDRSTHGLVPLACREHGGMVFVAQDRREIGDDIAAIPALLGSQLELVGVEERLDEANWKLVAESFLEGYHIKPTHRETFYPVQFDNLNVVEHFGRNSRVTFPYRNLQKLRAFAPQERRTDGTLTHVYHLFPNVMIATFPKRTIMTVLEPSGLTATRFITYSLADKDVRRLDGAAIERDTAFVDAGAREDRAVVQSIQRCLASEANEYFEYGLFEAAIVHFHRQLRELIDAA